MASLGYQTGRPRTMTNLPGAIGATTVVVRPFAQKIDARMSIRRLTESVGGVTTAQPSKMTAPPTTAPTSTTTAQPSSTTAQPSSTTGSTTGTTVDNHVHWLYGTAVQDLTDVTDDTVVVVEQGARELFVYPMKSDAKVGGVLMRVKKVHPVSAHLTYHWVKIASEDGTHYVDQFSFTP